MSLDKPRPGYAIYTVESLRRLIPPAAMVPIMCARSLARAWPRRCSWKARNQCGRLTTLKERSLR